MIKKLYFLLLKLLFLSLCLVNVNTQLLANTTTQVNKHLSTDDSANKLVITQTPIVSKIQLYGRVMPLDTIDISAPTNSKIRQIHVQLGQQVKKGQIILELESDQLDIDIRNAKELYIRSQIDYNKKQSWQNSDDVFQAKQSNIKNQLNYKRAADVFNQNKLLYDQGIISQNELEQSEIAYKDAKLNLELSDRHLKQIVNQGNETQLNLLALGLENAKAKLDILENIKEQLIIKSPIDGVILRANKQDKTDKVNNFLSHSQSVSQGENLLAIGNLEGFAVNILADEQVIQNVKLNQEVTITISALSNNNSYKGLITAIDAQPKDIDTQSGPPKYNIKVIADYTNNSHRVFLGMTTKVSFDLVEKENSILIPFSSLIYDNNQAYVVKYNQDKSETKSLIKLGKTTSNKIEVVEGLKSGDIIQKHAKT